ncbi:YjgN family protein [Kalamiella sp. sgz302252]|uniref:YjgN family protein n=1 Tax=Pantoea sp. sgz302252 TaxID=3341827 RepID=UPI0036D3095E
MNLKQSLLPQHKIIFSGKAGEYFKIWLVNLLLTIVTFGIYSAWATVRRRRYFYQNTEIAAGCFDYHASPVQILIGRILLVVFIFLYSAICGVLPMVGNILSLLLLLLVPWLIIRSWRFQARMSSYRGTRFDYACDSGRAYWQLLVLPVLLIMGLMGLISLTLYFIADGGGLTKLVSALPALIIVGLVGMMVIQGICQQMAWSLYINNHSYGGHFFNATLSTKAFIKIMLVSLLIMLPFIATGVWFAWHFISQLFSGRIAADMAVGSLMVNWLMLYIPLLMGCWFSINYIFVAVRNYVFCRTKLGEKLYLKAALSYLPWMKLQLGNLLLIVFSLGLATPLAEIRSARYLAEHCWLEGELPQAAANEATEEVAGAFAEEFVPVEGVELGF